jgi:hypothetical protein
MDVWEARARALTRFYAQVSEAVADHAMEEISDAAAVQRCSDALLALTHAGGDVPLCENLDHADAVFGWPEDGFVRYEMQGQDWWLCGECAAAERPFAPVYQPGPG